MTTTLVRKLQNLIFPPVTLGDLTPFYQPHSTANTVYLLPYKPDLVKSTIKACKYERNSIASRTLAAILDRYLQRFAPHELTIITVPQSYQRWRERGFDQLEEVVRYSKYQQCLNLQALKKHKHTKRQTRVNRDERRQQQAGTYTCQPAAAQKLSGTVILLDDVLTTGATMNAARTALASHLPRDTKLICLALAH